MLKSLMLTGHRRCRGHGDSRGPGEGYLSLWYREMIGGTYTTDSTMLSDATDGAVRIKPGTPLDGFVLGGRDICLWGWKKLYPDQ